MHYGFALKNALELIIYPGGANIGTYVSKKRRVRHIKKWASAIKNGLVLLMLPLHV
jgi:hypothetical protein